MPDRLLAAERSNDRITEAQYLVGRMIQAVFERGSSARLGATSWNDESATGRSAAQDLALILKLGAPNASAGSWRGLRF